MQRSTIITLCNITQYCIQHGKTIRRTYNIIWVKLQKDTPYITLSHRKAMGYILLVFCKIWLFPLNWNLNLIMGLGSYHAALVAETCLMTFSLSLNSLYSYMYSYISIKLEQTDYKAASCTIVHFMSSSKCTLTMKAFINKWHNEFRKCHNFLSLHIACFCCRCQI